LTRTETADFKTPSGKVELTSAVTEEAGYPLLPFFKKPQESPVSRMNLSRCAPLNHFDRLSFYSNIRGEIAVSFQGLFLLTLNIGYRI